MRAHRDGYSLVELSIVLVIVGLLTAGGLAMSTAMVERAAYIDSKKLLDQVDEALRSYYIVNNRLPCVAPLNTLPGATGFGVEIGATGTTCNNGAAVATSTSRVTVGSNYVRVGMLPVRTLGLPDSAASDKYGNRLVYAVTEKLTDASVFGSAAGLITVRDMNNNAILTDAAYFITSPGKDHKGAYPYSSGVVGTACGASSNLDVLNCTLSSAIFRDAPFNNGSQAAYFFDDLVRWAPKYQLSATTTTTASLWAASGGNIYSVGPNNNTATTNVGIGTATPSNKLHLIGEQRIDTSNDFFMHFRDTNAPAGSANWSLLDVNHTGNLTFRSRNDDWTVKANLLTMDSVTGNVGIGTPTPTNKFHLIGEQRIDSSNDFYMYFHNDNGPAGQQNWTLLDVDHLGNLTFRSRNDDWSYKSTLLSMNHNTGNVGIGTTTPFKGRLEVQGGPIYVGNMWLGNNTSGDTTVSPDIIFNNSGLIVAEDALMLGINGDNSGASEFQFYKGGMNTGTATMFAKLNETSSLFLGLDGGDSYISGSSSYAQALALGAAQHYDNGGTIMLYGRTHATFPGQARYYSTASGSAIAHTFLQRYGGTTTTLFTIYANGDAGIKGDLSKFSDMRLKKDICKIEDGLENLRKINGVSYHWNGRDNYTDTTSLQLGVIAQNVQSVYPELVKKAENGYLTVNMTGLIPVLIEAVKELDNQNKQLKKENADLEARITALEKAVYGRAEAK